MEYFLIVVLVFLHDYSCYQMHLCLQAVDQGRRCVTGEEWRYFSLADNSCSKQSDECPRTVLLDCVTARLFTVVWVCEDQILWCLWFMKTSFHLIVQCCFHYRTVCAVVVVAFFKVQFTQIGKKKFSHVPLVVCMHAYCFYFTVYVQVFSFQTARF